MPTYAKTIGLKFGEEQDSPIASRDLSTDYYREVNRTMRDLENNRRSKVGITQNGEN